MLRRPTDRPGDASILASALKATRPAFLTAIVFSFFINVLGLAAPLYMLQVYDRVLASRNVTTLLLLTLILAFVYAVSASLETVRSKVLIRAGVLFDRLANAEVFHAVQKASLQHPSPRHVQALRDIDTIREFYTGAGLLAFCDFPWAPVYIAAAFLLHPWYGYMAVLGSFITFVLALTNEWMTKPPLSQASNNAMTAVNHSVTTFRNAEVLEAMGMVEALRMRWSRHHEAALGWQAVASDRGGFVMAATKFNRMLFQSLILGLGAYLVIQREVTPGMMIAASIIVGKALAPVEIAISQWRSFSAMREAYRRVQGLLKAFPVPSEMMKLPPPVGRVALENVTATAPGQRFNILKGISVAIPEGAMIGVIGPSAAGKSTLARVLVGVWPVTSGSVRLDGSDLDHWSTEERGRFIGYLPQDVELFPGTVAENISRFAETADEGDIIAAARMAGVHEMIQHFTDGYNMQIGDGGQALSGGQRQRIGLARALYRMPPLIVLDEPNSNLDSAGEQALLATAAELKKAHRTVVLITHKTNILSMVDYIIVLNNGQLQAVGPRDQILSQLMGSNVTAIPDAAGRNIVRA